MSKAGKEMPCPTDLLSQWRRDNTTATSFSIAEARALLEHDNHEMRRKMSQSMSHPLFEPKYDVSLAEERHLALERLRYLAKRGFFSVYDFDRNPLRVFAAHEIAGLADGSMATKATVQFNLFGGTLLRLGTPERHHKTLLPLVDDMHAVGCFGLTELGYGNNAVEMETTAEYDHSKETFRIRTPRAQACKYWITNSAIHARYCIVFAQLSVTNVHQGVHAFLVPIRDEQMNPLLGVRIEDMGHKLGCNGVDNGKLWFDVEVPRTALLNAYSNVDENGVFSSKITGKRDRFLKVADQLLSGRLCIASMMMGTSKLALTIAVRYAVTRMAVAANGKSEAPLLSYQLQQNSLAPLLVRTIAGNVALNYCKDRWVALQPASRKLDTDTWREAVILCCAIKPFVSWSAEETITTCRERCGGQGYLSANRFGSMIGFAHAGMTAEGDNRVLMQKTCKELLTMISQRRSGSVRSQVKPKKNGSGANQSLLLVEWQRYMLGMREQILLQEISQRLKNKNSAQVFDIWMHQESDLVQDTAMAFTERMVFEQVVRAEENSSTANRAMMSKIRSLFAVDCIARDLGFFLVQGIVSPAANGALVTSCKRQLCLEIGPNMLQLVDVFGIPDHLIAAPIAADWVLYNESNNLGEHPLRAFPGAKL